MSQNIPPDGNVHYTKLMQPWNILKLYIIIVWYNFSISFPNHAPRVKSKVLKAKEMLSHMKISPNSGLSYGQYKEEPFEPQDIMIN